MAKAPKNSTSKYKKQNALYEEVENIIGKHPAEELFGSHLHAEDSPTDSNIPHRSLNHGSTGREQTVEQLRAAGIDVVERIPLEIPANQYDQAYLKTKRDRFHHRHGSGAGRAGHPGE